MSDKRDFRFMFSEDGLRFIDHSKISRGRKVLGLQVSLEVGPEDNDEDGDSASSMILSMGEPPYGE